jgi:hypothetical protein
MTIMTVVPAMTALATLPAFASLAFVFAVHSDDRDLGHAQG